MLALFKIQNTMSSQVIELSVSLNNLQEDKMWDIETVRLLGTNAHH